MPTSNLEPILESLAEGVVAIDRRGRFLFANASAERILGKPVGGNAADLVERFGLFQPDMVTPLPAEDPPLMQALRGDCVDSAELFVRHEGLGEGIWIDVSARPLRGADGTVSGAVAAFRNVTDRKQIEAALGKNEKLYRQVVENTKDGVLLVDVDHRATFVNRGLARMLGYKPKDILGRGFGDFVADDDRGRVAHLMERWNQGRGEECELRLLRKSGGVIYVLVSATPALDECGRLAGSLVTLANITGLRVAQEALRESEERYRTLFDTMAQGVIYLNTKGEITSANPAAQQILGLTARQMRARGPSDPRWRNVDSEGRPLSDEAHPAMVVLRTGQEVRDFIMGVFNPLEDRRRWIDVSGIPQNRSGEATLDQVCITFQDITSQKETQDSLREQKDVLQTILDHIPVMIFLRDPAGRLRVSSKEWQRVFGRPLEDASLSESFARLFPDPDQRQRITDHVSAATGEWGDFRATACDGRTVDITGSAIRLSDDTVIYIARDITLRKGAEARLKASEQKFQALVKNSSESFSIIDTAGQVLEYWSRSAEQNLGYDEEELKGQCVFDLVHPDDLPRLTSTLRELAKSPGASMSAECRFLHRDGSWRFLEVVATNLTHLEEVSAILVNSRDVTDQKQAEGQLRASHKRLRELAAYLQAARERERVRIAREIHDELGQMLTVLKMDLEGMAAGVPADCESLPEIRRRVERMSEHLQASIRSVKRISTELRPGVLDHLGLIAAMEWQAQDFQLRTGITCMIREMPRDLSITSVQSTTMFRIYQEILTNVARHAKATTVRIRLVAGRNRLTLEVRDNGVGITEEQLTEPKSLGLLGMRERAFSLGGTIRFTGVPGRGTTVTLRLPIGDSKRPPQEDILPGNIATLDEETAKRSAPSILLADDHEIFRRGLKEVLAQCFRGATIGEACDGEEAWLRLRKRAWDVLVLDVSMPRKSGLDLLKRLRAAKSKMPVLLLSSHAESQYGRGALRAGAAAYMDKGRPSTDVADAIRGLLCRETGLRKK